MRGRTSGMTEEVGTELVRIEMQIYNESFLGTALAYSFKLTLCFYSAIMRFVGQKIESELLGAGHQLNKLLKQLLQTNPALPSNQTGTYIII